MKLVTPVLVLIIAALFSFPVYAENSLTLDAALSSSAAYFIPRIPKGAKVALLSFNAAAYFKLSDYIFEELWGRFEDSGNFIMVDRLHRTHIEDEINYQLGSGRVDDDLIVSITQQYGAEFLVFGKIIPQGKEYRMTIYVTDVEKASSSQQIFAVSPIDPNLLEISLEEQIKRAVAVLARGVTQKTAVAVGRISYADTQTVSLLSAWLNDRLTTEAQKHFLVAKEGAESSRGIITGIFFPLDDGAEVSIYLGSPEAVLASARFFIPGSELKRRQCFPLPEINKAPNPVSVTPPLPPPQSNQRDPEIDNKPVLDSPMKPEIAVPDKPPNPKPAPEVQPVPSPGLQAPRNVRAGTPGTDSVTLSWDSAGSGISYNVYWSKQNDPAKAIIILKDPTADTSMNLIGMTSNTSYYFWVVSLQNSAESPKSSVVAVKTAAVPPVDPPPPALNNLVRINGGSFKMGSPASEVGRNEDEGPQHQVTVSGFWIGKYEVTQKEWREVMGNNPSSFKGDNLPVENVSWYDAIEYCNKRSEKEGLTPAYRIDKSRRDPNSKSEKDTVRWAVTWDRGANGYRLPTEAEWEYACRAGTTTPFSTGNNITTEQANYDGNYPYNNNPKGIHRGKTTPVGSFSPNAWGLYDMHGNLWEWCWDWYEAYTAGSVTDYLGASSGPGRVLLGGSWGNYGWFVRSAFRGFSAPSYRSNYLGFRVSRN